MRVTRRPFCNCDYHGDMQSPHRLHWTCMYGTVPVIRVPLVCSHTHGIVCRWASSRVACP